LKKNKFFIVLIAAILILLVLWLRENELRVKAETGYAKIQDKATSVINEKGEAIADLSTQLGEMQAHIQQRTEEFTGALTERDEAIAKLTEDARIAKAEHEAALQEKDKNIAGLESEMKASTAKYDAALKKKNKELSGIGEELRKTTERLATALKDKENAEAESYDRAQEAAQNAKKIAKLTEDNRHLEALAKLAEQKNALSDTAEGTVKAA
jgi:chromosome segregation ATPase